MIVLLAPGLGYSQQPARAPSDEPPLVIRSTTRLVQVNVVVRDRRGQPVRDLRKDDFTVLEADRPQAIAQFSFDAAGRSAAPYPPLPPNLFSNSVSPPEGAPATVTAVLMDGLNTSWEDQAFARNQVVRRLRVLDPSDRVALYSLGRGLRVLHDYTNDTSALLARLSRFGGESLPDLALSRAAVQDGQDPFALSQLFIGDGPVVQAQEADFATANRVLNTLKALQAIALHLATVGGRKSLVWVSGAFPIRMNLPDLSRGQGPVRDQRSFMPEIERAIRALNDANVAVYPVDARGLTTDPAFGMSPATIRTGPATLPQVNSMTGRGDIDTMLLLAERTGGKAYFNRNDIGSAVQEAFDDGRGTYTLGYYPVSDVLDGKFRRIKVRVNRPGVTVRHREGYFARAEVPTDSAARDAMLRDALWSPLDATVIGINARLDPINRDTTPSLRLLVQVDPRDLGLRRQGDRWQGTVDYLFAQKDEKGKVLHSTRQTVEMRLSEETFVKLVSNGAVMQHVTPRITGATTLRILVREATTGATGSLTIPLSQP